MIPNSARRERFSTPNEIATTDANRTNDVVPSFNGLIEAFRHQVRSGPDRTAMVLLAEAGEATAEISWRTLEMLVDAASSELSERFHEYRSLPRHIGHCNQNGLADVVIALASMSLGAVEFSFDHRLPIEERQDRWQQIGGLWVDAATKRGLADATQAHAATHPVVKSGRVDSDAPSLVLWTSGTTAKPRGVTLSARNLIGNAAAKLSAVPQSPQDHRLCLLPLSHAYARTCDFGTWLLSGCVLSITLGYPGLRRLAPLVQPTLMNVVPQVADRMLDDPDLRGLDRLRLLGCGGAAMSAAAFQRWHDRGVTVIQGYGLTEASPVICSARPENTMARHVGHFVEGWEWKFHHKQLLVRGPHVMLGYWNDPLATADRIDSDGWLATGDFAVLDSESGQVRILGRSDDVIVLDSAGKIHPAAVEQTMERLPGVRRAMLIQRTGLELWYEMDEPCTIERDVVVNHIRELLKQIPAIADCSIHPFDPPLMFSRGELTTKGTLCRKRIQETRFSVQAGS